MYKLDLVQKVARKTKLPKAAVQKVVDQTLAEVTSSLKRRERVQLTGFGTFEARTVKKRKVHNIKTGKFVVVQQHKRVAFLVGAPLKRAVRASR